MGASCLSFFEVVDGAEAHHPEIAGVKAMRAPARSRGLRARRQWRFADAARPFPARDAGNGNQADGMVTPR